MAKGSKKAKCRKSQNGEKHEMLKMCKWWKCKNVNFTKMKKLNLPLRPENAIPYGRRGTPWKPQNPKNAGPGGSEITKCRFYPFICHFGHFWPFSEMSLFSLFWFCILSFLMIFDFLILSLFVFCHFFTFSCFSVLMIFVDFLSFFTVVTIFDHLLLSN